MFVYACLSALSRAVCAVSFSSITTEQSLFSLASHQAAHRVSFLWLEPVWHLFPSHARMSTTTTTTATRNWIEQFGSGRLFSESDWLSEWLSEAKPVAIMITLERSDSLQNCSLLGNKVVYICARCTSLRLCLPNCKIFTVDWLAAAARRNRNA